MHTSAPFIARVENEHADLDGKLDGNLTNCIVLKRPDFPVNYVVHIDHAADPDHPVHSFIRILHGTLRPYYFQVASAEITLRHYPRISNRIDDAQNND